MPFLVDGADFDGTNDFLGLDGTLTGLADSKQGAVSAWFRLDGGDNAIQRILFFGTTAGAARFTFSRLADNTMRVLATNAAGTTILQLDTTATVLAGASWHHIAASWDLTDTNKRHLYLDGVSDLVATTYTDDTIDWNMATPRYRVGVNLGTTTKWNGCLAEVWFNDAYIDLSASLTAFRSAAGKPVNLGADGSTPIGSAPVIYLHLDDAEAVADFAVNLGTGEDFTITGTLETADTSPSDGQEPVADFSGTPLSGDVPLDVQFTDLTTNDPTSWSWDFGDSGTSTDQNPVHTYSVAGTYNVQLTATSDAGSDAETKNAYITANAVASSREETGAAEYFFKKKKKKGGTVIRRSDFESIEAYEARFREVVVPIFTPEPTPIEEEDDDVLLIALARILH